MKTAFGNLWKLPSFRRSFAAIADLSEAQLDSLAEVLAGEVEDRDVLAELRAEESETIQRALPVLETLTQIRDQRGLADLLDDVRSVAGEPGPAIVRNLERLLQEDLVAAQIRRIGLAQRAGLPVLLRLSLEVDFRVATVPSEMDEAKPKLVPVFIARLSFDEPVLGQDAIVFQVNPSQSDDLRVVLDKAQALMEAVNGQLSTGLLPPSASEE